MQQNILYLPTYSKGMKKTPSSIYIFFLLVIFNSCHTTYQSEALAYKTYQINGANQKDTALAVLLEPYKDSVNRSMDDVVGYAEKTMDKKQPECDLGNFLADAYFNMAEEKYHTKVDIAFLNYGGIRLTQLPKGEVTRGKIFELMPFDNLLILQKMKGDVLQQFLDHIAALGGWPVSGITMQIKDNKAINVMIGGKPLDPDKIYTTVNSDFVANGGDNSNMLRDIPQITNGYLMRDAIFDYIKKLKSEGKNIAAAIENRVSYAK